MSSLNRTKILLGITGGIAAYKVPALVRLLLANGADIQVVFSANAHHFVTPTAIQALTGKPVRDNLWDAEAELAMGHIELARWADLILITPATANSIAKFANGIADDLLSTLLLASEVPVLLAPAMNQRMYLHPATQSNLQRLSAFGYSFIGPDSGEQACGDEGPGRMSQPEAICEAVIQAVSDTNQPHASTSGNWLITAGPTQEPIDPVRYISNRSSGKQGLALAHAALAAGGNVTLVAGPGVPASNPRINRIDVITAVDMHAAVHRALTDIDVFLGVAAVADYRPTAAAEQKIKKTQKADDLTSLPLTENPDIIASVVASGSAKCVIGFAAETDNTLQHAKDKKQRKGLNAIILNDVSDQSIGFDSHQNAVIFIDDNGATNFEKQPKDRLAERLVHEIISRFDVA